MLFCACGYCKLHVQSLQSTVSKSMATEGSAAFERYLHVPKILLMERDTYACATYWLLVVLDGENSGVHCLFLHFTYRHVVLILARVKMKQFNKYFDRFHNKLLAVYILWNCIVWWLIFLPLLVWNKLYVEQVCSWWNMNKTDLLITNICHILYL